MKIKIIIIVVIIINVIIINNVIIIEVHTLLKTTITIYAGRVTIRWPSLGSMGNMVTGESQLESTVAQYFWYVNHHKSMIIH